eukprot:12922476-Alexandrium_andersonii.AAC.1
MTESVWEPMTFGKRNMASGIRIWNCAARRASWDRDLPGWMLMPGPILTRGLNDRVGAGAYEGRVE